MQMKKNISFTSIDKAKEFLENSNYFYKIKSFSKLFDKIENTNKYKHLYFDQLVELSKIDLYLRRILFEMCLSIEHQLKIDLINDISNDENEDGYSLVQCYFKNNKLLYKKFEKDCETANKTKNYKTTYASEIVIKYFPQIPIWALVETITFNDFVKIYKLYYQMKEKRTGIKSDETIYSFFWSIRIIRNACAHNNCIINSLNKILPQRNKELMYELTKTKKIKLSKNEKGKFDFTLITDITVIVVCFIKIIKSEKIRNHGINELKDLFENRCKENIKMFNYEFEDNKFIIDSFKLIKKIIDNYQHDG